MNIMQATLPLPLQLSVVVPTFNESKNIRELVKRLDQALGRISWELIVVDDNSPDGTAKLVKSLSSDDARIRCIRRIGRRGLSGACIEGILSSSAPYVVVMDGDLQHDETIIPEMFQILESGSDLAVGSRYVAGGSSSEGFSRFRSWGSDTATKLARRALKINISDPMSGFFMLRRETFEEIAPALSKEGFKILLDFISSAPPTLKTAEVPFKFRERLEGSSKLGSLVTVDYLGLLLSKLSGGILPVRFLMFASVGAFGVLVHLLTLRILLDALLLPFSMAQFIATMVAMTGNFVLNNELTYRDKKLRGFRFFTGLLTFYAACSVGTIANVGVASWINESWHSDALLSGLAGALLGAVYNYAAASILTWKN
ncbi:glycosyltransferase family 2 protein [Agrobacterium tumefaciens]|uniref:glycosyltransferase family 2 protein n=1 Tax=Agrobacterium tumefaciens TaxID=358 RepID=UPI001573945D|nr:glycosyltransferase family 2 protein [Agrobacterium tumefaciens]